MNGSLPWRVVKKGRNKTKWTVQEYEGGRWKPENQRESVRKPVIKHGRKEKNKIRQDEKPAQGARGVGKGTAGAAEDEASSLD